ncbi:hypothetical protein [Ideonella sp. A 288]|uniref:hypothetical protein n=1 Tax=Ideonella sp. A 288 TaxID=1962181 RepID=UPI000B4B3236|nr:hypothetical protein [Ideonella sp. A 288]
MGLTRRHAALAVTLAAAGCAAPPAPEPPVDDTGDRLWPRPPERPRYAWETDLRTVGDLFENDERSRTVRMLAGERVPREAAFEKPIAVAARAGRIYVADSVQRRIIVFDVPRRKVFAMGLRTPGTLQKPISVAVDGNRQVYVADATLRKVMVYDSLGLFQRAIGAPEDLERPTGVAVEPSGERVYVIDRGDVEGDRHRVIAYDATGKRLQEIGTRGKQNGQFNIPVQGAVDGQNRLWVLDAGNFRVQAFDRDGRFIRAFGQVGTGLGQFARPRGIACDPQGQVYVSDASFGNVQVFSPDGELLIALGRSSRRDLPGHYGLPHGVAVDETGRVYIVDQFFNKVEVLRPVGESEGQRMVEQAESDRKRPRTTAPTR